MRSFVVALAFIAVAFAGIEDLTCKIDNSAAPNGFPTVSGVVNWVNTNSINWWFSGSALTTGYFRWHIHNYHLNAYADATTAGAHFNATGDSIGELSNMFGNIPQTAAPSDISSGANCNTAQSFPTVPAYPIAGRSIVIHGAAGARPSCCTIGFYASNAGSTLRCEFNQLDANLGGYIDITATQVIVNVTCKQNNVFNSATNNWHIHDYQAYPWDNCMTTGGHYAPAGAPGNYSELAYLCGALPTMANRDNVVRTCNTTMFASQISPLQIAGRSMMLHQNASAATFAGCSIGYYNGTVAGPTCAPATTAPATTAAPGATTSSGVSALSVSVALLVALIALML